MARYITKVHMAANGTKHEHIEKVKYEDGGSLGEATVAQMVAYIEGGGSAKVNDGRTTVDVGVVNGPPKYIRTHADGKWTDNLLALPRY